MVCASVAQIWGSICFVKLLGLSMPLYVLRHLLLLVNALKLGSRYAQLYERLAIF